MSQSDLMTRIRALPIWQSEIEAAPLTGGITNVNYRVTDSSGSYVVRVGDDIPLHQVMRFNELAASKAAHAAGLSPAVVHSSGDLTVLEFIESRTLTEEDVRNPDMLPRVLELVKACHTEVPKHLRGPSLVFWVFHVIRDYAATLIERGSAHSALIPDLINAGATLEREAGPYDMVFGHNDLLCGNFLNDGNRLWLIDFDYAGFNSPLFDLGGLASNNGLSPEQEDWVLETYFHAPVTDDLRHRYTAMKCASLLRETMWSMVSEITSDIEFDYAAYTAENLARFRAALSDFKNT
ncbi:MULTISPECIES: phosphotransferase [unclassified Ruegeria]|uniref:phosphotransferase n=1 Tax=unclassified Ruegeria TaxID=2625375 RepID=UPI0014878B64|nr:MULTISPECIES: phosphotransferase [unclassified Ruegeria]NOD64480.1 phosphotransferase [Ruegeria sp. HKCCD6109]NOD94619.1 phosphotransferase [Ruegeria sp. HKCCD4884]